MIIHELTMLLLAVQRQARSSLPNIFRTESASASVQYTGTTRTAVPVAGPSTNSTQTQLEDQRSVLARLARGEGINLLEWDGVVETCDNCQKTFLGAHFKGHLRGKVCWVD